MFQQLHNLFGIRYLFFDFNINFFDEYFETAYFFHKGYLMLTIAGKSIAMGMHITATLQPIGYCCTAYALCIFI